MKTQNRTLFPSRRVHLIGISKSLEARPVADRLLSHAGMDPSTVLFIDAGLDEQALRHLKHTSSPMPEAIVVLDLPALVKYKVESDERTFKVMRDLQHLALDRNVAVIGVTEATKNGYGRERIAGSDRWIRQASTVVIVDAGPGPNTITASISAPNLKSEDIELALPSPN